MFNGLFNNNGGNGCGDCTWIILIVLFVCCCCGGQNKSFNLRINPCCLLIIAAMLYCCGAISIGDRC